jgi:hypothetical protein
MGIFHVQAGRRVRVEVNKAHTQVAWAAIRMQVDLGWNGMTLGQQEGSGAGCEEQQERPGGCNRPRTGR